MKKDNWKQPKGSTRVEYWQEVKFDAEDNLGNFIFVSAFSLEELGQKIKFHLSNRHIKNIRYGQIYTKTTTVEYKEFLFKVSA